MKQINLTAVILTKNEQENIQRCLHTLHFCDEILVIDDYSDDLTTQIAEENGAKVFIHALDSDYSSQRNFGLSKARGRWVLFVDADEIVSKEEKTGTEDREEGECGDSRLDFEGADIPRNMHERVPHNKWMGCGVSPCLDEDRGPSTWKSCLLLA